MALAPGTRLGPYEIAGPLGAGGMGEVYRALDTRLKRTVAVKTLPSHLASDPSLRARFEREARAVSALSHPNICTLHDIGEQDGVDFLVMEHIEGETLAARLVKGPLPVGQTLTVASQIAGALALAHKQGVVHRDLKPGNVMLTKTGAKLLDFGLAKQGLDSAPPISSVLMTKESPLTAAGTIVGTWQYLSPEQLEGHEADARSDIFAFGAMLYEMLTGRRAFDGRSQASLIAAIMTTEPPPLASAAPDVPSAIERVVRRCLAKDPEERWQSAADLASELKWIAGTESPGSATGAPAYAGQGPGVGTATPPPSSGTVHSGTAPGSGAWGTPGTAAESGAGPHAIGSSPAAAPQRAVRRERLAWTVAVGALLAAAAALAVLGLGGGRAAEPPRLVRAALLPPEGASFDARYAPSVSPDGRTVAFVAMAEQGEPRLYVQDLDSGQARVLNDTSGVAFPFWSPDSRWIAFYSGDKLKKIDIAGGPSIALCDAQDGRGGSWSNEGVILFQPRFSDRLFKVAAGGGTPEAVTTLDEARFDVAHRWAHFLPDGRRFIFYVVSTTNPGTSQHSGLYVGSLDGEAPRMLLRVDSRAEYAQGYLLYKRGTTLMAHLFDPDRAELTGDPLPLAADIAGGTYSWGGAHFGVSSNGVLVYMGGAGEGKTELVWVDRSGKRVRAIGEPDLYWDARISHDGSRVAMGIGRDASDLWVHDMDQDLRTRFTFDPADDGLPIWSPDDTRIAFVSSRPGIGELYERDAAGAGQDELLFAAGTLINVNDWSPDGRLILFASLNRETGWDLWLYSVEDRQARPWLEGPLDQFDARFSPDGRWIAYTSSESGRMEVYVQPFPEAKGRWQVSRTSGNGPVWRKDGKELFYQSATDNQIMAVEIRATATFSVGTPQPLFRAATRASTGPSFDVAPDGQHFLLNSVGEMGTAMRSASLVLNWPEALRR